MAHETDANPPGTPPQFAPTRARYGVLGFLCSLSFVLYLDRVCFSQAVVPMENDLGLTHTQIGYASGAFTIAYGLFEVPSGRWGDRFGSRGVLTRIVVWWSLFTALTGAATGLMMLVTVRFLFGAGEAGAYPNVARIIARWFPRAERGAAQAPRAGQPAASPSATRWPTRRSRRRCPTAAAASWSCGRTSATRPPRPISLRSA